MADLENLLKNQILQHIKDIEFDNLSQLNLSGNNIESVEVFHRIRMPDIGEIRIFKDYSAANFNYVANISQLRKIYFPYIRKNQPIEMETS